MSLILSKEVYDADYEIQFKHRKLYHYDNYYSDGEMVIDFRKNFIALGEYKIIELEKYKFDAVIASFITEEYLKKVLQLKNKVELSNITYRGNGLVMGDKEDHLIGSYYAEELRCLELFYYDNKIFFFVLNEATSELDIDFDSYMFVGFVLGCNEKADYTKENLHILQQLQYCLCDLKEQQ